MKHTDALVLHRTILDADTLCINIQGDTAKTACQWKTLRIYIFQEKKEVDHEIHTGTMES